jgi:hypothetical protein
VKSIYPKAKGTTSPEVLLMTPNTRDNLLVWSAAEYQSGSSPC